MKKFHSECVRARLCVYDRYVFPPAAGRLTNNLSICILCVYKLKYTLYIYICKGTRIQETDCVTDLFFYYYYYYNLR